MTGDYKEGMLGVEQFSPEMQAERRRFEDDDAQRRAFFKELEIRELRFGDCEEFEVEVTDCEDATALNDAQVWKDRSTGKPIMEIETNDPEFPKSPQEMKHVLRSFAPQFPHGGQPGVDTEADFHDN